MEKIKVIIADDNIYVCEHIEKQIRKTDNIEILAIVNNDEDEIKAIEELKPDIVITDIRRNNKDSGLDIIKDYSLKENTPMFLVISASIATYMSNIAGFIFKPINDYEKITKDINRIYEESIKKDGEKEIEIEKVKVNNSFFKRLLNKIS